MGFKRINRSNGEEIFEVKVTEADGRLLERWVRNKKDFPNVIRILNEAYDLGIKFESKKNKDLEWAM